MVGLQQLLQALVGNVGVDLGGVQASVAEHQLYAAQVGAAVFHVRGERVPQRLAGGTLVDARLCAGCLDGPLQHAFIHMVAPHLPGARVYRLAQGANHVLPRELPTGIGVFPS